MGIHDREYYREPQRGGFSLGGQRSIVTNLIIFNVAIYIADAIFTGSNGDHWLSNTMAMQVGTLTQPWLWWKTVTAGFAHSPYSVWHLLGNMWMLWMFGRDIETVYGRKEFLSLYLTMVVFASVCWALFEQFAGHPGDLRCYGASGAVTGVLTLFIFHFPKRTILYGFFLPIPAWMFGVMLVIGDMGGLDAGDGVAHSAHLAGAAFALIYRQFGLNLGRLMPGRFPFSLRSLGPRPKLRVHDPEDHYRELDRKADEILEKVSQEGESSLTATERRILADYSRRMRQKHR